MGAYHTRFRRSQSQVCVAGVVEGDGRIAPETDEDVDEVPKCRVSPLVTWFPCMRAKKEEMMRSTGFRRMWMSTWDPDTSCRDPGAP